MEFVQKLDEFIEHHSDEEIDQDEQIMGILKADKPYPVCWLPDTEATIKYLSFSKE